MNAGEPQIDRRLEPSASASFEFVHEGAAMVLRPCRRPPIGSVLFGAVVVPIMGVVAVVCAKGFLIDDGRAPAWFAYSAAAGFMLFCGGFGVAACVVPVRKELERGDVLRFERGTGRIVLPRIGREVNVSAVRGVWIGWGWSGDNESQVGFAQLALFVDGGEGEERLPVLGTWGRSAMLTRVGRGLARELGVGFEEVRITGAMMPTSNDISDGY